VTALERHRLMQDPSAFGARQVFMLADILVKETDDAEANVARRCSSSSRRNLFCSSNFPAADEDDVTIPRHCH